jgi:hypothetical protein
MPGPATSTPLANQFQPIPSQVPPDQPSDADSDAESDQNFDENPGATDSGGQELSRWPARMKDTGETSQNIQSARRHSAAANASAEISVDPSQFD